ncbi:pilin [Aeromonas veronii]|uniref:pilin n=1 Tax=Aeromonas veronii TaxID=654 RepID=UPI003D25D202
MNSEMKKQSGFTLIELMIVVAIVAILAAVALPAYQNYTKKAKMTEVAVATGKYKTAIEVCYQTKGTSCALTDIQSASDATATQGNVTIAVTGGAATAWKITAKPTAAAVASGGPLTPLAATDTYVLDSSTPDATGKLPLTWTGSCAVSDYCPAK